MTHNIADTMEMLADFDTRRWRTLATNLKNRKPIASEGYEDNIFKKFFQSFNSVARS